MADADDCVVKSLGGVGEAGIARRPKGVTESGSSDSESIGHVVSLNSQVSSSISMVKEDTA